MTNAKKRIIGIEFASNFIRVASGSSGSPASKTKILAWFETASLSDEDIAQRIKNATLGVADSRVIIFVPRRNVIVRFLDLPSRDEKEIRTMVNLQIDRHLPYSIDEIHYDIAVSPSSQNGYSHVILAALRKTEVNRILSIASLAGLSPDLVTLSSVGTHAACLHDSRLQCISRGVSVIIDTDHDESELIFIKDESIITTRSISHGPDFSEATGKSAFCDRLFAELETTCDLAKANFNFSDIDSLVLGPALAMLQNDFRQRYPQIKNLVVIEDANVLAKHPADIPPTHSIVSVLGINFLALAKEINFLPQTAQKDSLMRASSRERKLAIGMTIVLLAIIVAGVSSLFYSRYSYIRSIENELSRLDPEAKKISSTVKKIQIIDEIKKGQIIPLEILQQLYAIIPQKMFLTILEYDTSRGITIRGFAPTLTDVSDFLIVLQKEEYFANAEIKFAKQKEVRGQTGVDFEIHCPYFIVRE